MPDTKVVRAYAPGTKDNRALLAFMSNTDVVFDTDTGQTLRSILADMQSKIDSLGINQGSSTTNYTKVILSDNWSYSNSDKKYHISVPKSEHKLNDVIFAKLMITDESGNQLFTHGILDDVDYTIDYSDDESINLTSTTQLTARLILISSKKASRIAFTSDEWTTNDSNNSTYTISHDIHNMNNPAVVSVSYLNDDNLYTESYGVVDGHDYTVTIDIDLNIVICSTTPFSGRIVIDEL